MIKDNFSSQGYMLKMSDNNHKSKQESINGTPEDEDMSSL